MNTAEYSKKHVYVDIRNGKITVLFNSDRGLLYDIIPAEYMKDRDTGLRKCGFLLMAMSKIKETVSRNGGYSDFNLVFFIPDSFGLDEKRTINAAAVQSGLSMFRFYYDTDLLAWAVSINKVKTGRFITLMLDGKNISMASYEYSDAVLERINTYVATSENDPLDILNSKEFIKDEAALLYYASVDGRYEEFVRTVRDKLRTSHDLIFDRIVTPLDDKVYLKGLEMCSSVLTLRTVNTLFLPGSGPFSYGLSVNDKRRELFSPDTTVPANVKKEYFTFMAMPGVNFRLYEKLNNKEKIVAEWPLKDPSRATTELQCNYWLDLETDGSITFKVDTMNKDPYVINLYDCLPAEQIRVSQQKEQTKQKKAEPEKEEIKKNENKNTETTDSAMVAMIMDQIAVINNMEYGMKSIKNQSELKGVTILYNQSVENLKKYGVTCINETGVQFDTRYHNAVDTAYDASVPADYVLKIVRSGYIYKGKVLQFADVIVNKDNDRTV
ncbi:MAG: nucleotide exchange factor GrpE [Erysipelotrichaceae bacterium]|nr:nucleotide exchange factor GrpE [Erysipelotrichaceae bacterium]